MWHVLRAYKREIQAAEWLESQGVHSFVALKWEVRAFHGQPKRVRVPAIPSIIFVDSDRATIQELKSRSEIPLQWLMMPGSDEPMTVRQSEMDAFITIATQMEQDIKYFSPNEIDLRMGQRVRIIGGPMDGLIGKVARPLRRRSQRVYLTIENLATIATAHLAPTLLQPLD